MQNYYDDCNSGVDFKPKCDENFCMANCKKHFGYDEANCFNNECFCKKSQM